MDAGIFKKMKAKPEMTALVVNAPLGYPKSGELAWQAAGPAGFVHLFVGSKAQFEAGFSHAANVAEDGALFWLSYPKAGKGQQPDINRDSLWDLVIPRGWHPVAQVSLDDTWSAIRLRPNEAGRDYVRPGNMKAPG